MTVFCGCWTCFCNLSAGVEAKGRTEGITETYLASIKSLMEEMSLSAEKAMSVLRIPETERPKYLKLLGQEV